MIRTPPKRRVHRTLAAALAGLMLLAGFSPRAFAQPADEQDTEPDPAAGGVAAGVGTGEIDVRVTTFGIGNRPRPGDWVAVRVELLSRSDKRRDVLVTWSMQDAEGDIARSGRAIVPEPGQRRSVWLYGR